MSVKVKLPDGQQVFCFDGGTFDLERDGVRLTGQLKRVFRFMSDEQHHTLAALAKGARGSEAAVSARLRDLRKSRFGGFEVESTPGANGIWTYRLILGGQHLVFDDDDEDDDVADGEE